MNAPMTPERRAQIRRHLSDPFRTRRSLDLLARELVDEVERCHRRLAKRLMEDMLAVLDGHR